MEKVQLEDFKARYLKTGSRQPSLSKSSQIVALKVKWICTHCLTRQPGQKKKAEVSELAHFGGSARFLPASFLNRISLNWKQGAKLEALARMTAEQKLAMQKLPWFGAALAKWRAEWASVEERVQWLCQNCQQAAPKPREVVEIPAEMTGFEGPVHLFAYGFLRGISENWRQEGSPESPLTAAQMRELEKLPWFSEALAKWKLDWDSNGGRFVKQSFRWRRKPSGGKTVTWYKRQTSPKTESV